MDGCEILRHQKDGSNLENHGINHPSTGAGFCNHPLYHDHCDFDSWFCYIYSDDGTSLHVQSDGNYTSNYTTKNAYVMMESGDSPVGEGDG